MSEHVGNNCQFLNNTDTMWIVVIANHHSTDRAWILSHAVNS